jgi:hypothetical protein
VDGSEGRPVGNSSATVELDAVAAVDNHLTLVAFTQGNGTKTVPGPEARHG